MFSNRQIFRGSPVELTSTQESSARNASRRAARQALKSSIAFPAKLRTAIVAAALAAAIALPAAAPAGADPMTVCPPNQPSNWNGQPCFPQPCMPPYAPGVPPCFMLPPQIGPNGLPVFG